MGGGEEGAPRWGGFFPKKEESVKGELLGLKIDDMERRGSMDAAPSSRGGAAIAISSSGRKVGAWWGFNLC